ncbi:MAG: hypothetical protein ABR600_03070 [Actinomycetota bacterium]
MTPRRSRRWWFLLAVPVAAVVLFFVLRSDSEPPGHAFPADTRELVVAPLPVGAEWVDFTMRLHNTSSRPATIEGIELNGGGLDRVVQVVRIDIGPSQVRLGEYGMWPPARGCTVQRLSAVSGFVIEPGKEARIAVWMRTLRPGRYDIAGHVTTYEQDGKTFRHTDHIEVSGTVSNGVASTFFDPPQACVGARVRVLPEKS